MNNSKNSEDLIAVVILANNVNNISLITFPFTNLIACFFFILVFLSI